jgi:hypothetical protein
MARKLWMDRCVGGGSILNPSLMAHTVAAAAVLGHSDACEGRPARSGRQVADELGMPLFSLGRSKTFLRGLKGAYMAGREHAAMGDEQGTGTPNYGDTMQWIDADTGRSLREDGHDIRPSIRDRRKDTR